MTTTLEANVIDLIIDGLEAAANDTFAPALDQFLDKVNEDRWIISSDYSMGCPDFKLDAMVFTLIPYIAELFPPDNIEANLPKDFKKCGKSIDSAYLSYLRNGSFFTFIFLIDRSERLYSSPELARQAAQQSIGMMKGWPNAHEPHIEELIGKAELSVDEWRTKSFLRKANELSMLSTLGAFVGLMATRKKMFRAIAWAPDRDNMTGVWNGLASALFHANMHSVLHRRNMPERYIHAEFTDNNSQDALWFDPYIRLADFFATPAASLTRIDSQANSRNYSKCDCDESRVLADVESRTFAA